MIVPPAIDLTVHGPFDVASATYQLRSLGRNALWTGLMCLVLSTGAHFLATIEGQLGPFALSACVLSAASVPFIVGRFRELYLPIVSPQRYKSR